MKTRDGTTANATVSEADKRKLAQHFSKHMYQAVLQCTQASLDQVKRRVGSRSSGALLCEHASTKSGSRALS